MVGGGEIGEVGEGGEEGEGSGGTGVVVADLVEGVVAVSEGIGVVVVVLVAVMGETEVAVVVAMVTVAMAAVAMVGTGVVVDMEVTVEGLVVATEEVVGEDLLVAEGMEEVVASNHTNMNFLVDFFVDLDKLWNKCCLW